MVRRFAFGRRRRAASQAGFLLVELLVCLGLVALLAVMIANGLQTGRQVWRRIDNKSGSGEMMASAQNRLRDLIERSYPLTRYDSTAPYVAFQGEHKSLVFLSEPMVPDRPAELRSYRLELSDQGDLVLYSRSTLAVPDAEDRPPQILAHGVQGLELAYFGAAEPDFRPAWRQSWRDQPTLPKLVRLRISLASPRDPAWPDLIAAPAATIDTQCVIDAVNGRCEGRS